VVVKNEEDQDVVVPFHYYGFGSELVNDKVSAVLNEHIDQLNSKGNGFVFAEEHSQQCILLGAGAWILAGLLMLVGGRRSAKRQIEFSPNTPLATRAERKKRIYKQH